MYRAFPKLPRQGARAFREETLGLCPKCLSVRRIWSDEQRPKCRECGSPLKTERGV